MNNYNPLTAIQQPSTNAIPPMVWASCLHSGCGIGQYTQAITKALYNQGHKVQVWRKDKADEPYINHYPYRSFKGLKHEVAPFYLRKALSESSLDTKIWHADHIHAATALHWKKVKGLRLVTVHDVIPLLFSKRFSWNSASFKYHLSQAKKLDHCVTVSEQSKADLVQLAGWKEEHVTVIHNGIDHQRFFPNKQIANNKVFTIRYVGGLTAIHKNASMLLHIAKVLEDRGLKFRLEIGSGLAHLTHLPKLKAQLNLKQVHFVGFVPPADLRDFLATADVFIYPSLYEGFGLPPLEAMACGTPVVTASEGSLGEVVGTGGYLLEASDKDAVLNFADAIMHLMNNPHERERLAKEGLKQASKYSWQQAANKVAELYQKLL